MSHPPASPPSVPSPPFPASRLGLALGAGLIALLAVGARTATTRGAAEPPPDPAPEPTTVAPAEPAPLAPPLEIRQLLPESAWAPVLPMSEALAQALAQRHHSDAVTALQAMGTKELAGTALADRAFLLAWSLVRADHGAEAAPLIEALQASPTAPEPYRQLLLGEVLLASGKPAEAADALARVDTQAVIWPRARLAQADALFQAGRTADSLSAYQALADRPDPALGSEVALWALAQRKGLSSPQSRPLLVRLVRSYPRTEPGRAALTALGDGRSDADRAYEGDALQEAGAYQAATELLDPVVARLVGAKASPEACVAWFADGRARFKRNDLTGAIAVLQPAGEACHGIDEDRGAKALYIAGKALERRKDWEGAARVYERIPALYPAHSMADDGYALSGIAWQQVGDDAKAVARWTSQVEEQPGGDLAAEGFWRLAWTAYRAGDPRTAIAWAERSLATVPLTSDPVHVLAARYWAARWRIYPDAADPRRANPDAAAVGAGLDQLQALCQEYPTSFYALLAAGHLYELAPERAAVARPAPPPDPGGWMVRPQWQDAPATRWGLALARLGLVQESLAELRTTDSDTLSPSEYAVQAEILSATDPYGAHDLLHLYLLQHPAETLGADRDRLVHEALPDLYWDEVQQAAHDYGYDPRVFHALVREESSFNKDAKSWAGARGLSQLMPATARSVGARMGLKVSTTQLSDPLTNLRIGTRYYDSLVQRFRGNLYLSTAGYNAGEGNVERWLLASPGLPTDEFVEAIPLRETRHYVKRVLGTWQLYRVTYDNGPVLPDLSAFNHETRPG